MSRVGETTIFIIVIGSKQILQIIGDFMTNLNLNAPYTVINIAENSSAYLQFTQIYHAMSPCIVVLFKGTPIKIINLSQFAIASEAFLRNVDIIMGALEEAFTYVRRVFPREEEIPTARQEEGNVDAVSLDLQRPSTSQDTTQFHQAGGSILRTRIIVRIIFPNQPSTVTSFAADQELAALFRFVKNRYNLTKRFHIVTNFPFRTLTDSDGMQTFAQQNFSVNEVVYVKLESDSQEESGRKANKYLLSYYLNLIWSLLIWPMNFIWNLIHPRAVANVVAPPRFRRRRSSNLHTLFDNDEETDQNKKND